MRNAYIASVPTLRAPAASFPPGADNFLLFPGYCETSTTVDGVIKTRFPVRHNHKVFYEVWHRVRVIRVDFEFINGTVGISGNATLDITPVPTPDDETSRNKIGNNNWHRIYDASVGPQSRTIVFDVWLLHAEGPFIVPPTEFETRYYWRTDTTPNTMIPMMSIRIQVNWDDGTELTFDLNTSDPPPTPGPFYFEGTLDFFGIPVVFWADPDIAATLCDVSFSGQEWWPYLDANGENPIWNSETGEQLRNQWPIYGPNALL